MEDDIFIEVESEVALESRVELSFRNSLVEFTLFGGEEDLELAADDFLEDSVEPVETFLMEVVELFLVEVADD